MSPPFMYGVKAVCRLSVNYQSNRKKHRFSNQIVAVKHVIEMSKIINPFAVKAFGSI